MKNAGEGKQALGDSSHPDSVLRNTLFWALLGVFVAVVSSGYYMQSLLSYDTNLTVSSEQNNYPLGQIHYTRPIKSGSYGFYLARPPARLTGFKSVFLLGNSVYQSCRIVERMQNLADIEGQPLIFVNMAQTGAGMHDHILQFGKILANAPDLVVVSFANLAFTRDYLWKNSLPYFRTDSYFMAYDPDVYAAVPKSFYKRAFPPKQAVNALMGTVTPFRRMDVFERWIYGPWLEAMLPAALRGRLIKIPSMNLAGEWMSRTASAPRSPNLISRPYPDSELLIREIAAMAQAHGIPLLLIRQESGPMFNQPDMMPALERITAAFPGVRVIDFEDQYNATDYPDQIHPRSAQAQQAQAERHYQAVLEILKEQ